MLSIVVLACYLACAAWLLVNTASPAYTAPANSPSPVQRERARGEGLALAPASAAEELTFTTPRRRFPALTLGAAAVALHASLLWHRVFSLPEFALSVAETASLIGWLVGIIALVLSWSRPRFAGIGAILFVIAGTVAVLTGEGLSSYVVEKYTWEIAAHIILSTVAYALITIAAALAIALALLDRRLRNRQPLGMLSILPSVEALESGTFQALGAGFAVLTLALFSGFIFVEDIFAQHLIHKTVLSCLAWVVFAILLFGRWRFGWRGRTAMRWTLSGFGLLVLAYFGSKLVLESILGRHWG